MPEAPVSGGKLWLPAGLGAAEVHSHTDASDGMVSSLELVDAAARIGLNVLCITDHDTIGDLDEAIELGRSLGVDVVRGQELTCAFPPGTHLLGLFLERPISMHLTLEDAVDAIHDQGGLAVAAHPFMPTWFASMTEQQMRRLLERRTLDGIELRHTAPVLPGTWKRLDEFYAGNRERLGAALGSGDSHFGINDLGRVVTVFPGRTAAELRAAMEGGTTSPYRALQPVPPSLAQRLRQQKRSMIELNMRRQRGEVGHGVASPPRR